MSDMTRTTNYRNDSAETNPQVYNQAQWENGRETARWQPSVDIYETADEIVLRAELPGVKREDLAVNLENNTLTISGTRPHGIENPRSLLRFERPYGTFRRSFTLPSHIDQGQISSEFKQGLLWLHLPKRAETKPRQIEVKIS